jgi:hypothetical protein
MLVGQGRITLNQSTRDWLVVAGSVEPFTVHPLTADVAAATLDGAAEGLDVAAPQGAGTAADDQKQMFGLFWTLSNFTATLDPKKWGPKRGICKRGAAQRLALA